MEDNNEEVVTRNNLQISKRPRLRFLRYILAILIHIGYAISLSFFTYAQHLLSQEEFEQHLNEPHVWHALAHFLIQIPAAIYSYKFSAIRLFGICIFGNSILTFLFPILIRNGWRETSILIIIIPAFIQGLFLVIVLSFREIALKKLKWGCTLIISSPMDLQGAVVPAFISIWRYWAPPLERLTLLAIGSTGYFTGPMIFDLLLNSDLFNVEYILYLYGSMGIVWYFIWFWLAFEHPSQHPSIIDQELTYLQKTVSIKHVTPIPAIPWKNILMNMSIVTLIIVSYSNNLGFQWLIHLFIKVKYDNLVPLVTTLVTGFAADLILRKTSFSTTILRKIYICSGLTLLSLLILCMLLFEIDDDSNWILIMSYLFLCTYSVTSIGISVNHLDIAHKYAGITIALDIMVIQFNYVFGNLASLYLEDVEIFEFLDEFYKKEFGEIRALFVVLEYHGILNFLRWYLPPIIIISTACLYLIFGTSKQQNLQNKKIYAVIPMESTRQNLQDPVMPLPSAPLASAV